MEIIVAKKIVVTKPQLNFGKKPIENNKILEISLIDINHKLLIFIAHKC